MTLFEECIEALGTQVEVTSTGKTEFLFNTLEQKFPMLVSGHINWNQVNNKIEIEDFIDITEFLKDKNHAVFVFWDNAEVPALKSTLENVFNVIDDVTAVGFYTWLFSPSSGYVVEIHNASIMLGFFEG